MFKNGIGTEDFYVTNEFKSALIGLLYLPNLYQILLIYDNGVCNLYDLVKKINILEGQICEDAKHLSISPLNNALFFSNPCSKKIYYTFLEEKINPNIFFDFPSKLWLTCHDFQIYYTNTNKKSQENLLKEIYEESQIKILPSQKKSEYVLIFESSNLNTFEYMNQISLLSFPDPSILKQATAISKNSFLYNYIKNIENEILVICPHQSIVNHRIQIYLWYFKEKDSLTLLEFNSLEFSFGQIVGFNAHYNDCKLILATFIFPANLIKFYIFNLKDKENITCESSDNVHHFYFQKAYAVLGDNAINSNINQMACVKLDFNQGKKHFCDVLEINYSSFFVKTFKGFSLEKSTNEMAYNPLNAKYCIGYTKEVSSKKNENKIGRIDQKYFQLHRIWWCNRKLAYLFLLKQKGFLEKYGKHVVYEIIDFLT